MELHGTVFICTPKACNFYNNGCSSIVWAIYTWEDNCRLVCQWWWCCNAFPVVGEVSQWPFSTLSWGPCTDLNGWFNLNLATVTRLLAGIKLWTLFVVCIVKCFCIFVVVCLVYFLWHVHFVCMVQGCPFTKKCSPFQGWSTVYRGCNYLNNWMFGNNKWSGKMLFVKIHFAMFQGFVILLWKFEL